MSSKDAYAETGIAAKAAKRIEGFVQLLIDRGETTPAATEALRGEVKRDGATVIDHEGAGATFASAYLLSNFWKVVAALQHVRPESAMRVLDLGTGSAAAALAALAHFAQQSSQTSRQPRLVLVDRTKAQLDLACAVVEYARPVLGPRLLRPWLADLKDLAETPDRLQSDLVLMSHVLTENAKEVQELVERASSFTAPGGTLVIVERPDDELWADVYGYAGLAMPTSSGVGLLPSSLGVPSRRLRWLALRQPKSNERWLARLLGAYFMAWRERSPERIREVFTADATYHEKPQEPPLHGIDAIAGYWRRRVVSQEQPVPRPLKVAYRGSSATCYWEAEFRRDGYQFKLLGTMVIDGDPATSRIRSLREGFCTVRTRLRP